MTDEGLRLRLATSFPARQIFVLVERDGRLVIAGQPSGDDITSASMLLASVHTRLPSGHVYVSASIPGAAILRPLRRTGRGSILLAPVLERGVAVGAVLIEGRSDHAFTMMDLALLRSMLTGSATAIMQSH